jgi:methylmalonyl-CoA/ethylmalonyl-CoA epimerase
MKVHHLGYVGKALPPLLRRFLAEGAEVISGPIADPVQRVTVQFLRQATSGEVWELVVPLHSLEDSPIKGRIERGGGLDHVCYELEPPDGTLEEVLAREEAAGAHIVCPPVFAAAFARRIAFCFRRSGRLVEYVEVRPEGAGL